MLLKLWITQISSAQPLILIIDIFDLPELTVIITAVISIRALNIGGQKEELYDDDDLQSMGYAFRKAGHKITEEVTLPFTNDIKDKLQKADNSKKDGGKC